MKPTQSSSLPKAILIGYGYWGPNLLRNLVAHGGFNVAAVVDANEDARKRCQKLYPQLKMYKDLETCVRENLPDLAVIATPPETHKDLALKCINSGMDIMIEKPLAISVEQCNEIIECADKKGKKVLVDHTFTVHPAVKYLMKQVQSGEMGELYYYDSVRVNLGRFQCGANVLWDLAPHDLSILHLLQNGLMPTELTATGTTHFNGSSESLCYLHLKYANNFVAHLHLNWLAPVKIRTILLGGSKKMAIYDDNQQVEKVKMYDRGVAMDQKMDSREYRVNYRVGDMVAPALPSTEALTEMIKEFHDYIVSNKTPTLDVEAAQKIVTLLAAAEESLAIGGRAVELGSRKLRLVA